MQNPHSAAEGDYQRRLLREFLPLISESRRARMIGVLEQRSGWLRVVLDNVYQPHNASAVVRSCDCFGVQHLHVVEKDYKYRPNADISLGAAQWLTIHRYREAQNPRTACIRDLRDSGFTIVATSLGEKTQPLENLSIDRPLALVFGTEKEGLPSEWLEAADHHLHIPMVGFTQSLNVSVSVAICLHALTPRIRQSHFAWRLPKEEQEKVLLDWARRSVRNPQLVEAAFAKKIGTLSRAD